MLINLNGTAVKFNLLGDGFILISAVSYAFSSVFTKYFSKTENPVMLSGYQFVLGGLVMVITAIFMGGRFTVFSVNCAILLVYMALISAVAYSIWGILLKYNHVSKVTVYGFINPIFGVLLSTIILILKPNKK